MRVRKKELWEGTGVTSQRHITFPPRCSSPSLFPSPSLPHSPLCAGMLMERVEAAAPTVLPEQELSAG